MRRISAQTIYEKISDWIAQQGLQAGQRLPSERELMNTLNIGRNGIREALGRLTEEKVICSASPRIRVMAKPPQSRPKIAAIISGVPIPADIGSAPMSHILSQQLLGAIRSLHHGGWSSLVLQHTEDPASLRGQLASASAVVFLNVVRGQFNDALQALLQEMKLPVCCCADELSREELKRLPGSILLADHALGCQTLVGHLAERGCKRILRVWPEWTAASPFMWVQERCRGYVEGCGAANLTAEPIVLVPDLDGNESQTAFDRKVRMFMGFLLGQLQKGDEPTGILAFNDGEFHFIAAACRRLGYEPGRDVLIAGYDNYWSSYFNRRLWEPAIPEATMSLGYQQAGELLVSILQNAEDETSANTPQLFLYPPTLCLPAQSV